MENTHELFLFFFLLFWHDEICCDIDVKVFLQLQYRIYSGHSIR